MKLVNSTVHKNLYSVIRDTKDVKKKKNEMCESWSPLASVDMNMVHVRVHVLVEFVECMGGGGNKSIRLR